MAIETLNNGDLMSVQRSKLNSNFEFLTPILTSAVITTNWSGSTAPYTQTIHAPGVTNSSIVDVTISATATLEQIEAFQNLNVVGGSQSTDNFVLRACGTLNDIIIPIDIVIRGGF